MIDLTPLEVRQKKGDFRRAFRGYDGELVNDFLDLVADRMEELVKENMAYRDRVEGLQAELKEYRDKERALSDALMTAQRLREDAREHAEKEGQLLIREARMAAEEARYEANRQLAREEETLRQVRARRSQLVSSFRRLLERELGELAVIEDTLELEARRAEASGAEVSGAEVSGPEPSGPEEAGGEESGRDGVGAGAAIAGVALAAGPPPATQGDEGQERGEGEELGQTHDVREGDGLREGDEIHGGGEHGGGDEYRGYDEHRQGDEGRKPAATGEGFESRDVPGAGSPGEGGEPLPFDEGGADHGQPMAAQYEGHRGLEPEVGSGEGDRSHAESSGSEVEGGGAERAEEDEDLEEDWLRSLVEEGDSK